MNESIRGICSITWRNVILEKSKGKISIVMEMMNITCVKITKKFIFFSSDAKQAIITQQTTRQRCRRMLSHMFEAMFNVDSSSLGNIWADWSRHRRPKANGRSSKTFPHKGSVKPFNVNRVGFWNGLELRVSSICACRLFNLCVFNPDTGSVKRIQMRKHGRRKNDRRWIIKARGSQRGRQ